MLTGRKLLLADDSVAIQRVVELTFADEGMQVTSVGDGQRALEQIEHLTPDVILADAFMPGLNGYQLCRFIKDNERWAQIPVMLLVSSFEPFDEEDARRAGADDVVTKPFQSIRQLVSRVGSLLGGTSAQEATQEHAPADLTVAETASAGQPNGAEQNVTVLVEAAQMETDSEPEASGGACAPDIDFQTADTQQLDRIEDESERPSAADDLSTQDTIEIHPVLAQPAAETSRVVSSQSLRAEQIPDNTMNQPTTYTEQQPPRIDEGLLDLDEDAFPVQAAMSEDIVLDLDFEQPAKADSVELPEVTLLEPEVPVAQLVDTAEEAAAPVTQVDERAIVSQAGSSQPDSIVTEPLAEAQTHSPAANLSAEAMNEIARRVVEQMSEKVVREIAWEVVPELSELIIKKKLDEEK